MHILEEAGEPITEVDPVVTITEHAVLYDGITLDLRREHVLGLAVDVGTTTVVFRLIDLTDGHVVSGGAFENPQRFGGSDVMSRITYERDHPGTMRKALRRALNAGLKEVYAEHGIDRHEVYEAMIVANSTMRDLFFDLDVKPIGEMPYKSITELAMLRGEADSTWITKRAYELGILIHPQARVVGAPLIASHVGGDVAADLVATDFGSAARHQPAHRHRHQHRDRGHRRRAHRGRLEPGRPGLRGRHAALRHARRGRCHRGRAHQR